MLIIAQIQHIKDSLTRILGKVLLQGWNGSAWENLNSENGALTTRNYQQAISEGDVSGHSNWSKIGYNGGVVAATEAEIWSATGTYTFPTAAAGMEVLSSDNTQDIGTIIFSGTSDGGSTTTLSDSTKDFTAGTPVAAGDFVILDKAMEGGRTPEWGIVTSVATTTLTIAAGFSSGGTGIGRTYSVIDKSAHTGAFAVRAQYLDGSYSEKTEIIILNGTTVVPTVNLDLFRINSFRMIAAGSGNKTVGNISIRNLADTPIYSYISAGYTRARNIIYTVPAGKTLFVTSIKFGYGYSHNSTHYARMYTRANVDNVTGFRTGDIFYPYTEGIVANTTIPIPLEAPTKLPEKTDIKVSIIADYAGVAEAVLRGWIE